MRNSWRLWVAALLAGLAAAVWMSPVLATNGPAAARRVALIIGNADYTRGLPQPEPSPCPESNAKHLCNVSNDTLLVKHALLAAGFEDQNIILKENLRRGDIMEVIDQFKALSHGAQVSLIYLAGHGVESKYDNWFIPIGSRRFMDIDAESDIPIKALNLDTFVSATDGAAWRIVVMDACRNNLWAGAEDPGRALLRKRTAAKYQHDKLDPNTLLIYSTAQGKEADDGPDYQSSDFAVAFARRIAEPNLPLQRMGQAVQADMKAAARPNEAPQIPWVVGDLPDKPFSLVVSDSHAGPAAARAEDPASWRAAYAAFERTGDTGPVQGLPRRPSKRGVRPRSAIDPRRAWRRKCARARRDAAAWRQLHRL